MKFPVVKEGFIYIGFFAVITLFTFFATDLSWAVIPGIFLIFITFFFRNPERNIPNGNTLILSPADGKIMNIEEVFEDGFLSDMGYRITIFLSVFNVHINRSPINGEIKYQHYTCGRFRPAYKKSAGFENERLTIGLENNYMRILVTQIAGILARRIVSWVTLGSVLESGERYGMIKFGSCTEIIIPKNVKILVKKGDKVKGGETIIGRLNT